MYITGAAPITRSGADLCASVGNDLEYRECSCRAESWRATSCASERASSPQNLGRQGHAEMRHRHVGSFRWNAIADLCAVADWTGTNACIHCETGHSHASSPDSHRCPSPRSTKHQLQRTAHRDCIPTRFTSRVNRRRGTARARGLVYLDWPRRGARKRALNSEPADTYISAKGICERVYCT
jgi:hypothetical protein